MTGVVDAAAAMDRVAGALACCGRNQNDQVSVAPYAESAVVGFYWPKGAPLPAVTGLKNLPFVTTAGKPVISEV